MMNKKMRCENNLICSLYSKTSYTCNQAKRWERSYCGFYKDIGEQEEEGWFSKAIEKLITGLERVCGGDSLY